MLARVQQALAANSAEILRLQIGNIDRVDRMADGREILCYQRADRRVPDFAAKQTELRFATVHFSVIGMTQSWTAHFYLVRGHFFSIVFTPTAKMIRSADTLKIDRVEILSDPSHAIASRSAETKPIERGSVILPSWLEKLESTSQISGLFEALSPSARQHFLRELTGALPFDYLELVDVCEGLDIGNLSILGLSQVYEIVLKDWNYYAIAEVHSIGVLAVKVHTRQPEVYFLSYAGAAPRPMGASVAGAIKAFVS